jgi:anthranilate phosphoribosyltransferase
VLKRAIARLVDRTDLSREEMAEAFESIFAGSVGPAQLGAFLIALRMKGETPEEIAGAASAMRARATRVRCPPGRAILDTCGTGGDGAQTFNVSTAVALVATAAGATVAKHGNRSVSSRCGSADVLEAAGVTIDAEVSVVERCIERVGMGFLFAPRFHGAMKHVAPIRRELAVRSIFNLLGPLANPAFATHQLLGVYDGSLVPVVARTLAALGIERALVVHGHGGIDEVSPFGPTRAALVEGDRVEELVLSPEDVGMGTLAREQLAGGTPEQNAQVLIEILDGRDPGPAQAVVLNAAGALWICGLARSFREGADLAREVLSGRTALAKLEALVAESRMAEQQAS